LVYNVIVRGEETGVVAAIGPPKEGKEGRTYPNNRRHSRFRNKKEKEQLRKPKKKKGWYRLPTFEKNEKTLFDALRGGG